MTNEEIFVSNIMQKTIENWIDLSHELIEYEQYTKTYKAIREEYAEKIKEINQS